MGVMSALLQGGYTRRVMNKVGEGAMARRGVMSCTVALALLALLPLAATADRQTTARWLLRGAAACMAFTSATVVNALTAYASLQCDDPIVDRVTGETHDAHPQLAKGSALGKFRSTGQLGRAIGPLLGSCPLSSLTQRHSLIALIVPACGMYWTLGPTFTYATSGVAMLALTAHMRPLASRKTKTA